jgi:hypothetical protein
VLSKHAGAQILQPHPVGQEIDVTVLIQIGGIQRGRVPTRGAQSRWVRRERRGRSLLPEPDQAIVAARNNLDSTISIDVGNCQQIVIVAGDQRFSMGSKEIGPSDIFQPKDLSIGVMAIEIADGNQIHIAVSIDIAGK